MIFIIVMTMCGVGPNGLICQSNTPPQLFSGREMCEIAADVTREVIKAKPPANVRLSFVHGTCLNIGVGA